MTNFALTLGPVHYHWSADRLLDFYARIADEAPVDTVYLGEVVCSKRTPFFEDHYGAVIDRLKRAGKSVVLTSLAEVMLKRERDGIAEFCATEGTEIEVNDASALYHISGRPHRLGPFLNVYNEWSLRYLAGKSATHVTLTPELPGTSASVLASHARDLGVGIEVQVFGRASLALSARCYHARAHKRTKDNCQFVCEQDPDGMTLATLNGQSFLAVNGIQTLSNAYVNLLAELPAMKVMGIGHFRISPQVGDIVKTAAVFRAVLDERMSAGDGMAELGRLHEGISFSNGFWHGKAGHQFHVEKGITQPPAAARRDREPGNGAGPFA